MGKYEHQLTLPIPISWLAQLKPSSGLQPNYERNPTHEIHNLWLSSISRPEAYQNIPPFQVAFPKQPLQIWIGVAEWLK